MADEQDVKLKIKVDAREVDKGEASLNRLKKAAKDVGGSSDDLKKAEDAATGAATGFLSLGEAAGPIGAIVSAALVGIVAITGAMIAAATTTFELAKAFAEFTEKMANAADATGLSIETISALNLEAAETHTNFEQVTRGLEEFTKTIGEAADGSTRARGDLRSLGIDGAKAANNIEGAFAQAIETINGLTTTEQKVRAATKAFGENGKDIIPFLNSLGGNLDAVKKKADELGWTLSRDDVKASEEFNRAIGETEAIVKSATINLGREVLPVVKDVVQGIAGLLEENKGAIKDWATTIGDDLRGLKSLWDELNAAANGYLAAHGFNPTKSEGHDPFFETLTTVDPVLHAIRRGGEEIRFRGQMTRLKDQAAAAANFDLPGAIAASQKGNQEQTAALIKERTEELRKGNEEALAADANYYAESRARLNTHLNVTRQDEIDSIKAQMSLKRDSISHQITMQTWFFDQLLQLNKDDAGAAAAITSDKNKTIEKLRSDLIVADLEAARGIAEKERQILEERRRALIEFKQLQIRDAQSGRDSAVFDIERAISRQVDGAGEQFSRLEDLTNSTYQEIARLTQETYAEQLKDASLTAEQRVNIETQMRLDLRDLAEKNREDLIAIEDRKYDAMTARLEKYRDQAAQVYSTLAEQYSAIGQTFFNPETFSSKRLQEFRNSILKSSEIAPVDQKLSAQNSMKDLFYSQWTDAVAQNRPKSTRDDLYNSFEVYKQAAAETEKELEKLKNTIPGAYFEFEKLASTIAGGNITAFDDLSTAILKNRQLLEANDLTAEIQNYKDLADIAAAAGDSVRAQEYRFLHAQAERKQGLLAIQQTAEKAEAYSKTLAGINEQIQAILNGETAGLTRIFAGEEATRVLRDLQEIKRLEYEIANGTAMADALEIQKAKLEDILELRHRETEAIIASNRAQLELAHSMEISNNQIRAQVLQHLAQQKTLNESIADGINGTFDALQGRLDDQIDKMFEWAGAFKSLFTEPLKAVATHGLTQITKGLLNAFLPEELGKDLTNTKNPIARPIVKEIQETNRILHKGFAVSAGSAGALPGTGGGLASILHDILHGGSGERSQGDGAHAAQGNTPSGYGHGAGGGITNDLSGILTGTVSAGPGGGGILDRLKTVFGTGEGGIFAPVHNILSGDPNSTSRTAGIASGIGAIAQLAGSLVGGRIGSTLSMAGTGLQIGAMFGPWGAVIGAAAGALLGFFGFSDPKRKKDKNENIPALNKGFTDAIEELKKLLQEVRTNPDSAASAVTRATEIRSQIASGFGIQFLSKKYQKVAQQQIATKLGEADSIIEQINAAAEIARGSADRSKRILPEFASGVFMDSAFAGQFADFKRQNGVIPGTWTGADNVKALIAQGEMVLNPMQQAQVRIAAGFDAFASANIPNYRGQTPQRKPAKFADGVFLGTGAQSTPTPIVVQPNLTLVVEGAALDEKVTAYLKSDDGVRTQIKVQKKLRKEGSLS